VKLDIFTVIGDEQVSAEDVASRLEADQRGVERLLNALVAMGLLLKVDGRWANTSTGRSLLSKDADGYIGHIIRHHHHLAESWVRLDEAVKQGGPVRNRAAHGEAEWRESFLMGMFNLAMETAPRVADALALSGCGRLLDVGGGPGTYAIHFCLKTPDLTATVYDLPTTQPFAEKTIARFGLTDRVRFLPGNYVEQDVPGSYDVAWLSHILHGEGPDTCRRIVEKVVSALTPGGKIIVHDFILDDTMDGPVFPALFSLNMLLGTSAGQSYSEAQITDMLSSAGVKGIERIDFRGPTDSGIILGAV
jgi:predicted O-methyltransferase YrrM